jgi:hypothetical protein
MNIAVITNFGTSSETQAGIGLYICMYICIHATENYERLFIFCADFEKFNIRGT